MTYDEAVALLASESGSAHEPRCFEVGDCDVESAARQAREALKQEVLRRRKKIEEAVDVINEHLAVYDRKQIVPTEASA